MSASLSAVIVTHNSAEVITGCLDSVRTELPGAEIVVVDNSSTDNTQACVAAHDSVKLLVNSTNIGFGRACNQGAHLARGSLLVLLNPDVTVMKADVPSLINQSITRPFGLMGPLFTSGARVLPITRPESPWPVDLLEHLLGPLIPRELGGFPRIAPSRGAWWPGGAVLLVARDEFLAAGGFRPEFFLYYEDRDLARRYRAAGLPVRITPAMLVSHIQGTSSLSPDRLRTVPHAWAYLSWIEYLCIWHGDRTARRAVVWSNRLRLAVDRSLARLEGRGPVAARARRKRKQLQGIEGFIRAEVSPAASTAESFCPRARHIVAGTKRFSYPRRGIAS
jgi:N-acetylglucosaminyl-diphospho-decaprenol L-rhamnosyltransferase